MKVVDAGGAFTGSAYPASATVAGVSGMYAASLESVTPSLTYYSGSTATGTPLAGAPSASGVYTVVARFGGSTDYTAASAQVTFSIGQAGSNVMAKDSGGVYNGQPFAASGTVTGANGANLGSPTFTYYLASDTTFSNPLGGAPSTVGSYTVVASYSGDGSYSPSSNSASFSITPATPTVKVVDSGGTYTGSAYPATATVAGVSGVYGASLEGVTPMLTYYSGPTATGTPLAGAPSAAGTYTVVARFAGSTDYVSASGSTTFSIVQASSTTVVTVKDAGGVYTSYSFAATGTVSNGKVNLGSPKFTYYLASDTKFAKPLSGAPSSVGKYVVVASYAGSGSYPAGSASTSFSITPASPTIKVAESGGVYTGKAFAATATVAGVNGVYGPTLESVTPKLTYYSATANFSTPLAGAPTAVGKYVVVASFPGSADYTSASTLTTFSINAAIAKVTLSNLKQIYTGKPEFATATASPSGVTVQITYTQNGKAVASPINPGTYTVTATVTSPGYIASVTTGSLVIAKANPIVTVTGATITYDGKTHAATGSAKGVESTPANLTSLLHLSYENLATGVISTTAPSAIGTYDVFASFDGNADYNSLARFNTGKQIIINAASKVN